MNTVDILDSIPAIQPGQPVKATTRQFQLRLETETFLRLEIDAARRGTTSYKLGATLIKHWVDGKLTVKKDEPKTNSDVVVGLNDPVGEDQ